MGLAQRIAWMLGLAVVLAVSVQHFHFAVESIRATGVVDFPIFLRQAADFLETGRLYPHRDVEAYAPAAAVYKFPPLYAMFLLPLVREGFQEGVLFYHWLLQILLYGAAVGLAILALRSSRLGWFLPASAIVALNFEPFFETLWRLQIETPLLLLLTLCLVCFLRGSDCPAGLLLGVCAMLKVYPAFLLVYFVVKRRWRVVGWCSASMLLILVSGWIVIGSRENYVYFFKILPHLMRETPVIHWENLGLGRFLQTLGGLGPEAAKRVNQLLVVPLILVSMHLVHQGRNRLGIRSVTALEFSLFVPLVLLAMPNAWANYQLLLLLPLLTLLRHGLEAPLERVGSLIAAAVVFGLSLFYSPCADPTVPWPCAETPFLLGLFQAPRPLHDLLADLRACSPLLLWAAIGHALWTGNAGGTEPGDRAGWPDEIEVRES